VRRLFVAVWPPEDVLDRVAALPRPEIDGLRWNGREHWHVTLRFLGPVAEVDPVTEALAGMPGAAVTARLGPAVGRFGQRILHIPVEGLDGVAAAVVGATAHLGKPPDDRPFHGHLTLARVATHGRVDLRPLTGTPVEAGWDVEAVCLVESRLSPHGARYEVLERFPLVNR
jgi:2'-5' RNA ligase